MTLDEPGIRHQRGTASVGAWKKYPDRSNSTPPTGATSGRRPPRGAFPIPRPLAVVDYLRWSAPSSRIRWCSDLPPISRMTRLPSARLASWKLWTAPRWTASTRSSSSCSSREKPALRSSYAPFRPISSCVRGEALLSHQDQRRLIHGRPSYLLTVGRTMPRHRVDYRIAYCHDRYGPLPMPCPLHWDTRHGGYNRSLP